MAEDMAETFDSLMHCSIGTAGFILTDRTFSREPIVENGVRTGSKVQIELTGEVVGANATTLAANLASLAAATDVDGTNCIIYQIGNVKEIELLGARCRKGGPHYTLKFDKQSSASALRCPVSVRVEAETMPPGTGSGDPTDPDGFTTTEKVKTATRPDGLLAIVIAGKLTGAGSTAYWEEVVRPFWQGKYSFLEWVWKTEVEPEYLDTGLSYTISLEQIREPYPLVAAGAGGVRPAIVVDGENTIRSERDEKGRFTSIDTWDLLLQCPDGWPDVWALVDLLRKSIDEEKPYRERVEYTGYKEARLRCEFTRLRDNGDVPLLLDFAQSVEVPNEQALYQIVEYDAAPPIMLARPYRGYTATQTGRATGNGEWPAVPPPLWPTNLSDPPRIGREYGNLQERVITWSYSFCATSPNDLKLDAPRLASLVDRASAKPPVPGGA